MTREPSKRQRTEEFVWLCVLVFASRTADQDELCGCCMFIMEKHQRTPVATVIIQQLMRI